MYLDIVEVYMEHDQNMFDEYMDLIGSNKKKTFNLDYYDSLAYNDKAYNF